MKITDPYTVIKEFLKTAHNVGALEAAITYDQISGRLELSNSPAPLENIKELTHTPLFLSLISSSTGPIEVISNGSRRIVTLEGVIREPEKSNEPKHITTFILQLPDLVYEDIRKQAYYFAPEISVSFNGFPVSRFVSTYSRQMKCGLLRVSTISQLSLLEREIPTVHQGFKLPLKSFSEARGYIVELGNPAVTSKELRRQVEEAIIHILVTEASTDELLDNYDLLHSLDLLDLLDAIQLLPPKQVYTPEMLECHEAGEYYDDSDSGITAYRTDKIFLVPTLQYGLNTIEAFDSAVFAHGSICNFYGNIEILSEKQRGIPDRASCTELPVSFSNVDFLETKVYAYTNTEDPSEFRASAMDIFINFAHYDDLGLQVLLSSLACYQDGAEDCLDRDIQSLHDSLSLYNWEQKGIKEHKEVLALLFCENGYLSMPQPMRNKQFKLSIDGRGRIVSCLEQDDE